MFGFSQFAMGMAGPGMILFWGLLIALVFFALRGFAGRARDHVAVSALEILNARFARGEIDETEYRKRRTEIER